MDQAKNVNEASLASHSCTIARKATK